MGRRLRALREAAGLLAMFGENSLTRVMLKEYDDTTALVLCDVSGKQVWAAP